MELQFRLTLGPAYMAIRGYAAPEVEACYQRARELCRELGDTPQLVPVLHGLWSYHIVRAQHTSALALGEQVLELGAATEDDGLLLQGNMEVGWSHFFLGELQQAREHLERVLALYDHERHSSHAFTYGDNPATSARGCLAQVLWLLGYPDQSLRHSEENLATLRSLQGSIPTVSPLVSTWPPSAPVSRRRAGDSRAGRGGPRALRGARPRVHQRDGIHLQRLGAHPKGELGEGMAQMRRGLAAQLATGAELARPYWLSLIAEACHRTGRGRRAGAARRSRSSRRANSRTLLGGRDPPLAGPAPAGRPRTGAPEAPAAEASYRRALDVARGQGARSLELRAAVSLSRLWQAEGRQGEARELLAPIYERFPEGRETSDLRAAASLLTELGGLLRHEPDLTPLSGGP